MIWCIMTACARSHLLECEQFGTSQQSQISEGSHRQCEILHLTGMSCASRWGGSWVHAQAGSLKSSETKAVLWRVAGMENPNGGEVTQGRTLFIQYWVLCLGLCLTYITAGGVNAWRQINLEPGAKDHASSMLDFYSRLPGRQVVSVGYRSINKCKLHVMV